jgi:FAD/FMN-containing dehydrogenase
MSQLHPAPGGSTRTLRSWNNHLRARCTVYRPERAGDIERLLRSADGERFIPRGLGRSYSDAHLNPDGGVILGERLDKMIAFDRETGVLECEGGVPLGDVIDTLLLRGFFPPVTPGTRHVSIGGAIANDVHGKNHHRDGSFGSHVLGITLLTPRGETIECSPGREPEVFWATVGGLGLTGVILRARIQLQPVESGYLRVNYTRTRDLDETLACLRTGDEGHRHSIAWIDATAKGRSLGRGVVMLGDHAAPDDLPARLRDHPLLVARGRPLRLPFYVPQLVYNRVGVRTFNRLYSLRHPTRRGVIEPYHRFFHPLDGIEPSYRLAGRKGFVQFQAVYPYEKSVEAMAEVLERVAASGRASFLAVLKAMGPANDGMLSFPSAGHTIAIDLVNKGSDLPELVRGLNERAVELDGRVYLAKDAFLEPAQAAAMYPALDRFRDVRRRLDPAGRFSSALSRRLEIMGAA